MRASRIGLRRWIPQFACTSPLLKSGQHGRKSFRPDISGRNEPKSDGWQRLGKKEGRDLDGK